MVEQLTQIANPSDLQSLTPIVAVCVVFAGLLGGLQFAFLRHLNAKDARSARLVNDTHRVLNGIQRELQRLADNDARQTEILIRLLDQRTDGGTKEQT